MTHPRLSLSLFFSESPPLVTLQVAPTSAGGNKSPTLGSAVSRKSSINATAAGSLSASSSTLLCLQPLQDGLAAMAASVNRRKSSAASACSSVGSVAEGTHAASSLDVSSNRSVSTSTVAMNGNHTAEAHLEEEINEAEEVAAAAAAAARS